MKIMVEQERRKKVFRIVVIVLALALICFVSFLCMVIVLTPDEEVTIVEVTSTPTVPLVVTIADNATNEAKILAMTPEPTVIIEPTATQSPPPQPIDYCNCSGNVHNCSDFSTHATAQACYNHCMQVTGYDIHRLDRDKNGLACEGLPG